MRKALKVSGLTSKKATIVQDLRLLVKVHRQKSIRRLRGMIVFDSDTSANKGMM
ncbi:MAG: hypothetical protein LZF60_380235 [Nitrospira sp.]|nr:MAG: hypothetical protein LZF60_380235 [Nitrospira sp.]